MCNQDTYPVKPSIWMERTLFKSAIIDPEFKNVMDNFNFVSLSPTLEKYKTEVRKHEDKLSKEKRPELITLASEMTTRIIQTSLVN